MKLKLIFKIKIMPLLLCSMLLLSCNNWLDMKPNTVQTGETFWQTKEEVEGVLMSSYLQLRKSMPWMLMWGELRGNGITFGPSFIGNSDDDIDKKAIRELEIIPTNKYAYYSELYKGISYANYVIKLGPGAMKHDGTLTEALMDSYLAEAVFLRSLYYFYLVKVFQDVPYVKDAYESDDQEIRIASTKGDVILQDVLLDLKKYAKMCKPGYEVAWQSKGRATSWSFYALIADISLWLGNYKDVIDYCEKFEGSTFKLTEMNDWMSIYYPGNSVESIFELQYDHQVKNQQNNLYSLFWQGDGQFVVSQYMYDLFLSIDNSDVDVRGLNWGYTSEDLKLWKFAGTVNDISANGEELRSGEEQSPNFIFYRYADIIFMQAEALVMQSDGNIPYAFELLDNTIRKRAGYSKKLQAPMTQSEALKIIVDERLKEFVGEGKSWFDILRMSRCESLGIQYLQEQLLPYVPADRRSMAKSDLNNRDSHYLPIHEDEIRAAGGILKQNSFYEGFTETINN